MTLTLFYPTSVPMSRNAVVNSERPQVRARAPRRWVRFIITHCVCRDGGSRRYELGTDVSRETECAMVYIRSYAERRAWPRGKIEIRKWRSDQQCVTPKNQPTGGPAPPMLSSSTPHAQLTSVGRSRGARWSPSTGARSACGRPVDCLCVDYPYTTLSGDLGNSSDEAYK